MKLATRNKFVPVLVLMLCVSGPASIFAANTVRYDQSEAMSFPEGCGSAFQDVARFADFFDSASAMLVAKRGAKARGAVDLFAVSALRERLLDISINYSSESPIDRLIIAQLCQFQKIRAQEQFKGGKILPINAGDEDLLNHMAAVAASLVIDSRAIVRGAMQQRAEQKRQEGVLAGKKSEITEAKLAGERKAKSLIGEN